jgi:predicted nucleic acid-binding Zn ribbon protein
MSAATAFDINRTMCSDLNVEAGESVRQMVVMFLVLLLLLLLLLLLIFMLKLRQPSLYCRHSLL